MRKTGTAKSTEGTKRKATSKAKATPKTKTKVKAKAKSKGKTTENKGPIDKPDAKSNTEPKKIPEAVQTTIGVLRQFSATYSAELGSKMDRLDGLIGRKHWLSVGEYKESIVREILRKRIPRRFEVGTGFVMGFPRAQLGASRQVDVLVWDCTNHAPFFQDGNFAIVPFEAANGLIEIKSTLTASDFKKSFNNLDLLRMFNESVRYPTSVFRAVFAYAAASGFKTPEDCIKKLYHSFEASTDDLESRAAWTKRHDHAAWSFPWIDMIVVLGAYRVLLQRWSIDGETRIVYIGFREPIGSIDDTYGDLERRLLWALAAGNNQLELTLTNPEFDMFKRLSERSIVDCACFSIFPDIKGTISQIGSLGSEANAELLTRRLRLVR